MKLGFLTASLPDMTFKQLVEFSSKNGFNALEVACWPSNAEKRRYIGVQHIDIENLNDNKVDEINDILNANDIEISSLAYYTNPLDPDIEIKEFCIDHLKKLIIGANKLGVSVVCTFAGRNKDLNISDSLTEFKKVFDPLVKLAEDNNVKIAIENCPMLFEESWPGGLNIAYSPAIWERMFTLIDSKNIGLNFDPSHLLWQQIDYVKCLADFSQKIFHTHTKDTKMLENKLNKDGILGFGYYEYRLTGFGDIDWKSYFAELYKIGFNGAVSIEHEDAAFEIDEQAVLNGLLLAKRFLKNYI